MCFDGLYLGRDHPRDHPVSENGPSENGPVRVCLLLFIFLNKGVRDYKGGSRGRVQNMAVLDTTGRGNITRRTTMFRTWLFSTPRGGAKSLCGVWVAFVWRSCGVWVASGWRLGGVVWRHLPGRGKHEEESVFRTWLFLTPWGRAKRRRRANLACGGLRLGRVGLVWSEKHSDWRQRERQNGAGRPSVDDADLLTGRATKSQSMEDGMETASTPTHAGSR